MDPCALTAVSRAKCIVLDYDGVIADSEEFQLSVWRELLAERGLPFDGLSVGTIAGLTDRLAVEKACPGRTADLYDRLVREKKLRCDQRADCVQPVPGTRSFLESVRGWKLLSICSGSPVSTIARFLGRCFPDFRFSAIVGKEDYARPKPHPDAYLKVLEHVGVGAEEAVVIEDSPAGIEAARAAGLQVIYLDRYGGGPGDVPSISSAEALTRWRSDR